MPPDPRKEIGSRVKAKAIHVSNLAECARRYGKNKLIKVVFGTVLEVINSVNPTSNRASMYITANYDLGGGTMKEAKLNIRSVKAAPLELDAPDPYSSPPDSPLNFGPHHPPIDVNNPPAGVAAPAPPSPQPEVAAALPSSTLPAALPCPALFTPAPTPVAQFASTGNSSGTISFRSVAATLATPVAVAVPVDAPFPPTPMAEVPAAGPVPVVVCHEQEWFSNDGAIKKPQNGRANNYEAWGIHDSHWECAWSLF